MSDYLELAILPFQLPFMQYAFVITLMIAVPMAMLSCFLVLKGWSLMGDAVSHAVLPGVVVAYIVGIPLSIGAFIAGMICALGTGFIKENSRIKEDTVLGIVFSGMFGLGLVLYVKVQSDVHLDHILFGDMLGIAPSDMLETGLIALFATLFLGILRKDLLVNAFDAQHAKAIGLPVRILHYGLLMVLSLTVVGALKAVGIILSVAMLVAPGAIAFLLTRRFSAMLLVAMAVAVASSLSGIWLSFLIDSAPAPTIVMFMSLAFVATFIRTTWKARRIDAAGKQASKQRFLRACGTFSPLRVILLSQSRGGGLVKIMQKGKHHAEVGSYFLCHFFDRRRVRLYWHFGSRGGRGPYPVLHRRGDLPGLPRACTDGRKRRRLNEKRRPGFTPVASPLRNGIQPVQPPSITWIWPVVKPASSEAR